MKNIYFIVLAILIIIYIVFSVKKSKLSIKESFWWVIGALCVLILSIFPKMFDFISIKIGVSYPPSLFFVISILFLCFMIYRNSKRIAEQQEKIIELGQQVAILKEKTKKTK